MLLINHRKVNDTVPIERLEDVVGFETHELEDIKYLKICMKDIQ
jgi:hypothetical protein